MMNLVDLWKDVILIVLFFSEMTLVNECPKNENETIQASKKLNCGLDEFDNNQYLCLPHVNKTSLVEFCFNGTMGIQEKGKLYCKKKKTIF